MSILTDRIKALKTKAEEENTTPYSYSDTRHTLANFLVIYNKAQQACFMYYMAGAKELHYYLTCGRNTPLDLELDKYPQIEDNNFQVNRLLSGYDSYQLAVILSGETYGAKLKMYERAIYFTTLDLVSRGII